MLSNSLPLKQQGLGTRHRAALRLGRQEVQDAPALLDVRLGVGPQRVHQVRELVPIPAQRPNALSTRSEQLLPQAQAKQCAPVYSPLYDKPLWQERMLFCQTARA